MGLCPGGAPRPDGALEHVHFRLAGVLLGKHGSTFKVDKGLLKYPCAF